jgi:D-amino-acid dehydrogenase
MTQRGSAVVIGGGVIGVCSAYYLAQDGWDVTLVEKGEVASGASYGNAGLVVPSHSIPLAAPGVWVQGLKWMLSPESPFYIKPRPDPALASWLWKFRANCTSEHVERSVPLIHELSLKSRDLYRELARLPGVSFGFAEEGVIMVFRTEKGLAEARHEFELMGAAGSSARVLNGDETRKIEPAVSQSVIGSILLPEDARLIPGQFVSSLAQHIEGAGVRLLRQTEVLGLRRDETGVTAVETTRGVIHPDQVVLATGAWSPGLGAQIGVDLPIQAAKGYSLTWRRPPNGPRLPLLLGEGRAAITPMGETLRIGGTLELAGLDMSINRRRVKALWRAADFYLGSTRGFELLEIWRGLRPCTPDGLPLVGRLQAVPNVTVAAGHAMIGMSLGPVTGKLVSELVGREPTMTDISLLRPERFD